MHSTADYVWLIFKEIMETVVISTRAISKKIFCNLLNKSDMKIIFMVSSNCKCNDTIKI